MTLTTILALAGAFVGAFIVGSVVIGADLRRQTTAESIRYQRELDRVHNHFASPLVPRHQGHDVVPVETGGEIVAHLCVTCDKQLPATWRDPDKEYREQVKQLRDLQRQLDGWSQRP